MKQKEVVLNNLLNQVKAGSYGEISTRISSMVEENSQLKKQNQEMSQKLSSFEAKNIANEFEDINGKKVLLKKVHNYDKDMFSNLFDSLKTVHNNSIIILANILEDKVSFIAYVSKELVSSYKAGMLIKKVTSICGGSGGGRPDVAQGGGKNPSKVDEAFLEVKKDF